jgi:RimJ/RimL family protein N-acetyltransferase
MKKISIKTPRLILRPFCEKDLLYLKKLLKDTDIMKFSVNGPYNNQKIQKFIDSSIEDQRKYGFGSVAVILKDTDE